jgi:hypothetical protein
LKKIEEINFIGQYYLGKNLFINNNKIILDLTCDNEENFNILNTDVKFLSVPSGVNANTYSIKAMNTSAYNFIDHCLFYTNIPFHFIENYCSMEQLTEVKGSVMDALYIYKNDSLYNIVLFNYATTCLETLKNMIPKDEVNLESTGYNQPLVVTKYTAKHYAGGIYVFWKN